MITPQRIRELIEEQQAQVDFYHARSTRHRIESEQLEILKLAEKGIAAQDLVEALHKISDPTAYYALQAYRATISEAGAE